MNSGDHDGSRQVKASGTSKPKRAVKGRSTASRPAAKKSSHFAKLTAAMFGTRADPKARVTKAKATRRRQSADTSKFVLVYNGLEDPDPMKVDLVVRSLAPAKVSEVLPGTLSVEGDGNRIARIAERLDSWSLSSEGLLSSAPPSVTRFNVSQG